MGGNNGTNTVIIDSVSSVLTADAQFIAVSYDGSESAGGQSVWKLNGFLELLWSYDVGATCHYLDVHTDGSVFIAHDENSSWHVVTKLDRDVDKLLKREKEIVGRTPLSHIVARPAGNHRG